VRRRSSSSSRRCCAILSTSSKGSGSRARGATCCFRRSNSSQARTFPRRAIRSSSRTRSFSLNASGSGGGTRSASSASLACSAVDNSIRPRSRHRSTVRRLTFASVAACLIVPPAARTSAAIATCSGFERGIVCRIVAQYARCFSPRQHPPGYSDTEGEDIPRRLAFWPLDSAPDDQTIFRNVRSYLFACAGVSSCDTRKRTVPSR
jgi:hypothetical protein